MVVESLSGTRVEIDQATRAEWAEMMGGFSDANIYQTWGYGEAAWGAERLSHLVLKRGRDVLAMVQVVIARFPLLGRGLAQVRWGPLCMTRGGGMDVDGVRALAEAMHLEYVVRRRLFLRIYPAAPCGSEQEQVLDAAFRGFEVQDFRPGESYRTLLVDLEPPLDVIRRKLDQKWRNQLNRAERNGLQVRDVKDSSGFEQLARLDELMRSRKRLPGESSIGQFSSVQARLDEGQRMIMLLAEHDDLPVAGVLAAAVGRSGVYLAGASSDQGLALKASYLLQWRVVEILKSRGVREYDLGGINPDTNPGVYHFKKGMNGRDAEYMRPRVACNSWISALSVGVADRMRQRSRTRIGP